jgi:hypothetical protein
MYGKHQDEIRLKYLEDFLSEGSVVSTGKDEFHLTNGTINAQGKTLREAIDKAMLQGEFK